MAVFYSKTPQTLLDGVVWLPQDGASAGPTGRPPNSYAVLNKGEMLLVDAPFSWVMGAVAEFAANGHRPRALVLTHSDLVGQADAIEELRHNYQIDVLMHPDDASEEMADRAGISFEDPRRHEAILSFGLDVLELPFHTPGSIMLHRPTGEGLLFAGDSAVAPGPLQAQEPPRLERPKVAQDRDEAFRQEWGMIAALRFFNTVLPLHGTPYVNHPDLSDLITVMLASPPMDPSAKADGEPNFTATGVAA